MVVVALGAGGVAWRIARSAPPPPVPAVTQSPPTEPPPEPALAKTEEVGPATDAGLAASTPQLAAGFCAPGGDEGSVSIKFTLPALIQGELNRRLANLPEERKAEVLRSAPAVAKRGVLPSDDSAELLLLAGTLQRGRAPSLFASAQALSEQNPNNPYLLTVRALGAEAQGQSDLNLDMLRRAQRLLPEDPAIGIALFLMIRDAPDVEEAIAGLEAYLAADPSPPLARLRARLEVQRDIQHDFRRQNRNGLTLLWPSEALSESQAEGILSAVDRALDDAASLTGIPRRTQLTVIVYPGRAELLAVSCVQAWTGGLYDGSLRLVAMPETRDGVDLTALRHESLHAQLSPALTKAPKWFHEGLAQSFANESAHARSYWKLMVQNRSWVPFSSLDDTFQVFEANSDAGLAYAQSLALVELIRELGGASAVPEAIRAFREGATTPTVLARASQRPEVTGADLVEFLKRRLADP